mmetsp:Transcript_21599/g.51231  ORF Transcript_21599/g.51231 Transcript_21599/m.51231 type:complete len:524 (-) Transcript_21599:4591-6162(-)
MPLAELGDHAADQCEAVGRRRLGADHAGPQRRGLGVHAGQHLVAAGQCELIGLAGAAGGLDVVRELGLIQCRTQPPRALGRGQQLVQVRLVASHGGTRGIEVRAHQRAQAQLLRVRLDIVQHRQHAGRLLQRQLGVLARDVAEAGPRRGIEGRQLFEPLVQGLHARLLGGPVGVEDQVDGAGRVVLGGVPRPLLQHVQPPQVAAQLGQQHRAVHALAGAQRRVRQALEAVQPEVQEAAGLAALRIAGRRDQGRELEAAGRDGGIGVELPQGLEKGLGEGVEASVMGQRGQRHGAQAEGREVTAIHHLRVSSSASTNIFATSKPLWSVISWKQVGLVTLISVTCSPITSRPTSSRPRAARMGPRASAISRSRAVNGRATPLPPAARLPRTSPPCGMRARQCGTGRPPMTRMRLSPSAMAGRKRCTITVCAPSRFSVSMMAPRLRPSSLTRKMPMPPMPSRGLRMMSRCSAWKARISAGSRVTSVGAMNSGNSKIASFSGCSRSAPGLLKTRAPSRSAWLSRWVA